MVLQFVKPFPFLLRFIRKMQDWETTNERSGNKDLNAHKNKIMINIAIQKSYNLNKYNLFYLQMFKFHLQL